MRRSLQSVNRDWQLSQDGKSRQWQFNHTPGNIWQRIQSRHPDVSWAQKQPHPQRKYKEEHDTTKKKQKKKQYCPTGLPSTKLIDILHYFIIYCICPSVHQFWNIAWFGRIAFECLCSNPPKLWHLFQSENPAAPVVAPEIWRSVPRQHDPWRYHTWRVQPLHAVAIYVAMTIA